MLIALYKHVCYNKNITLTLNRKMTISDTQYAIARFNRYVTNKTKGNELWCESIKTKTTKSKSKIGLSAQTLFLACC